MAEGHSTIPDSLYHYTVPTGHGRWSPRPEVGDDAIRYLREMLRGGKSPLVTLLEGWQVSTPLLCQDGAWSFCVGRNGEVIATCWLLLTDEQAANHWPIVQRFAEDNGGLAVSKCPKLPCLAVVPYYSAPADRETWLEVGDLERCVAWALLEIDKQ